MPISDLIRPEDRAALRRFRRRLANRECMRRIRAADPGYGRHLCAGVDLPGDGGTCGRLVDKRFERCIRCHNRRRWLLLQTTPYELAVLGALEAAVENDVDDHEVVDEPSGALVPLLNAVDDALNPAADPCLRW